MKISNFSKTVHTILTKFCIVILHTKASKSYGLGVRNIAKISPKMAKKQPFFDFFRFSEKLSIRFERNFLQLFYTILESYMCNGIKNVWLGCEKQPKLSQKWPKNSHFSIFFDFLKNCPYDSNEIFYSHSTPHYGPLCAISLNSYGWDVRNIAKFSPKMAKKQSFFDFFRFSHKLLIRFERKRVRRKKT